MRKYTVRVVEELSITSYDQICQDTRTAVVPQTFARRLLQVIEEDLTEQTWLVSPTLAPTTTLTLDSLPPPTVLSIFQSDPWPQPFERSRQRGQVYFSSPEDIERAPECPEVTSTLPLATPVSNGSRFILFMVNRGGLHLHEIDSYSMSNDQLFDRMRFAYRQSRGWFRTWFGLTIFSHCDFCKASPRRA